MAHISSKEMEQRKRIFKSAPVNKTGFEVPNADAETMAGTKASAIIKQAENSAELIVKKANDNSSQIHQKAKKDGFAKGQVEARQRYDNLLELIQKTLDDMESMRREITGSLRETIISLGLEIAGKTLKHEIETDPLILKELVDEVLAKISPANEAVLRLSQPDYDILKELQPDFESAAGYPAKFKISPDPSLGRGDVVVNYERGTIDARIATQLKNITDALMERND